MLTRATIGAGSQWRVDEQDFEEAESIVFVVPKTAARPPCPTEVAAEVPGVASDYLEACLVLADSPKASAALSRRCLQNLLRSKAKVTPGNLVNEIEEAIKVHGIPSHIAELLHGVREIGNFAAHPTKDRATGEIMEVEPGEAEINLEVLEALFDFFFVAPAKNALRKAAISAKLTTAGKKPLK